MKNKKAIKTEKEKTMEKVEKYFFKKPGGKLTLKLKDGSTLRIRYMYGFRYTIVKRTKSKRVYRLAIIAKLEEVAETILEEKEQSDPKKQMLNKIKGQIK